MKRIHKKWAVITNQTGEPLLVLDAEAFVFAHRPIVVTDPEATVESVLDQFVVDVEHKNDRVIDRDVILSWSPESKRIITGADILGRLLQGIVRRAEPPAEPEPGDPSKKERNR